MCANTHAPCGTQALLKKSYPLLIILQLEHLRLTIRCNLVDDILTWLLYVVLHYVEELLSGCSSKVERFPWEEEAVIAKFTTQTSFDSQ